jgi:hypothetical protein
MPTFVGFLLNQGAEIGQGQEQGMGQTSFLRHFHRPEGPRNLA